MKTGTDRKNKVEFRDSAVRQVLEGGRGMPAVARSLEMSIKTLANWVCLARKGQALVKRRPQEPVSELQAEVSWLRQENARLRVEKEILKKRQRRKPPVLCLDKDVKYAWIDEHRGTYSTTMMCELLSVSRSGLNAARARAISVGTRVPAHARHAGR